MKRGSEWGRWDLHVHTKDTAKNDRFGNISFEDYCIELFKSALENEIKVIGITDYFSIENYEKVKDFQNEIYTKKVFTQEEAILIKKIVLLPNMELRILPTSSKSKLVNIHIIFNPEIVELFKSTFLPKVEMTVESRLSFNLTKHGIIELGKYHNPNAKDDLSAYAIGLEQFVIDHSQITNAISSNKNLLDNCLIFISNNSNDGVSGVRSNHDSISTLVNSLYKISHGIFSAKPADINYFLGRGVDTEEDIINKYGALKPCIHGCDAHELSKIFKPDLDRFCWIKAEPSFDGLKQILYEPETRVYIGPDYPDQKLDYEVIDRIVIGNDSIVNEVIYFNPNLNTIVGGRSSGKSTLVQCIANKVAPSALKDGKPEDHIQEISDTMKIIWKDEKEDDSRSVDYFYQGHMYSKAEEEGIESIVKGILQQSNAQLYEDSEKQVATLKQYNAGLLSKIFSQIQLIKNKKEQIKNIGNKEDISQQLKKLNELISQSSVSDYSSEELKTYEEKQKKLKRLNDTLESLEKAIEEVNKVSIDKVLSFNEIPFNINAFQDIKSIWDSKLDVIRAEAVTQVDAFKKEAKEALLSIKGSLDLQASEISQDAVFKEIEQHLKDTVSLKPLIAQKDGELKKLEQIVLLEGEIKKTLSEFRLQLPSIYQKWKEMNNQSSELVKSMDVQTDSSLEISPTVKFKKEKFREFITKYINQQPEKAQRYANTVCTDVKDLYKCFKEIRIALKDETIKLKSNFTQESFITEFCTTNWFKINYDVLYEGDNYVEMSQGKKAFVVLKLSLECSDRKCPIIIDQPEDDLDNRAIYTELVTYIKEKKSQRQIILVTHNANVVVNADSEQIIVANRHGSKTPNKGNKKFEYKFGSIESNDFSRANGASILESKTIKEHICEILEGGDIAFKLREQKYNF